MGRRVIHLDERYISTSGVLIYAEMFTAKKSSTQDITIIPILMLVAGERAIDQNGSSICDHLVG